MGDWHLVRPGIRLFGHWMPDLFDYPFRFVGPKVGDAVFVIVRNRETKEFKVAEDKITDITDYAEMQNAGDPDGYLIDYWIDKYNQGHGLTYGDVLFETEEDAQEVLNDILANLDKWDS